MLPRIFDLFTQADSTRGRAQGGLGIGLTLVRTLVELHGGAVEAKSGGLGLGSELIVRLPLLADPPVLVTSKPAVQRPALAGLSTKAPRRILIVDDNIDSGESLMMLLTEWGHEVRTATDAASALEVAHQFRPEVMFVDIGLPGMNGYDLARELRSVPGLERAVLVAVTGYGRDEDRRASLDAGFDDHWVKPIDLRTLSELALQLDRSS